MKSLYVSLEVAHQKHHPQFPAHLMPFGQVEVKAPQLLPGLYHNPTFHDNIFIAELAHLFEFLIALYKN
jgi:hypothetical protein